ncbi:16S rRNA processing protein RimM [Acetitomaculum ruminis DSM 5522]|uniref:Ribosome maturation factor RimM n=1 Tax=Acetitomaculum ruminis DSM 5522 TaxID=1120918 RepID=A0A1I0VQ53_9FIRM|nr:ribosome maturation factor RimM [Acetitomaculum ruminis]SFA78113.1 16S rRNA processing protein RimM [Acetitomaculum ruminis DSM 5522]
MEDFIRIGKITTTHGLKGEVKVYPNTDDPKRFKQLKSVYIELNQNKTNYKITSVRFFKNLVLLKFDGIVTIEEAEKLKQGILYVERKDAVPLEEDEYYVADLIGMTVLNEDNELIGELTDVIATGANDVYVVKMNNKKEVLVPAIKECILSVNIHKNIMQVHLLDGLLDL